MNKMAINDRIFLHNILYLSYIKLYLAIRYFILKMVSFPIKFVTNFGKFVWINHDNEKKEKNDMGNFLTGNDFPDGLFCIFAFFAQSQKSAIFFMYKRKQLIQIAFKKALENRQKLISTIFLIWKLS